MIFNNPDENWVKWFAWRPVDIERGIAWLCYVERRWVKDFELRIITPYDPGEYVGGYEYRALSNGA